MIDQFAVITMAKLLQLLLDGIKVATFQITFQVMIATADQLKSSCH